MNPRYCPHAWEEVTDLEAASNYTLYTGRHIYQQSGSSTRGWSPMFPCFLAAMSAVSSINISGTTDFVTKEGNRNALPSQA